MRNAKTTGIVIFTLALIISSKMAYAGVIFTLTEVGGDVLIEGSGSYDLTGAAPVGSGVQDGFIDSSLGLSVGGPFGGVDFYGLTLNPGAFGTGGFLNGNPDFGDRFGIDVINIGGFITVPTGYVSGDLLSGSTLFSGQSFASLGLVPGTFEYGIPNDTLTVQVDRIPEAPMISLFGLGLAGLGWLRRKKA